jgi:hypothetical protein
MISAQTRSAFVARENRFTLRVNAALRVRIMPPFKTKYETAHVMIPMPGCNMLGFKYGGSEVPIICAAISSCGLLNQSRT